VGRVSECDRFILVTTDQAASLTCPKRSARDIVRVRLNRGLWPLYERTPYRRGLRSGAAVALYAGRFVIATATITGVIEAGYRTLSDDTATESVAAHLRLENVSWLDPAIDFRERLPRLTICPKNMSKWGIVLMGGIRGISCADWETLLQDATNPMR